MTGRRQGRIGTCALLAALVLFPRVAAAQSTDAPPRISLGAGAGLAVPLHGDFDFTPWAWDANGRVAIATHALFDLAIGEWRHSGTVDRRNIPVSPVGGVIGRFEATTTRVQRTFQANVLFTAARGRLRMAAGGGVGLLQHVRRTQTVTADCTPGVTCGSFESISSSASGSAQAVGGAELRLAGPLALYGDVRFVVPFTDPAGSDLRVTSGLRWGFGR